MRQVDQVHDAEDQRQARGEQEQHQAELKAVQRLLEEEDAGSCRRSGGRGLAAGIG